MWSPKKVRLSADESTDNQLRMKQADMISGHWIDENEHHDKDAHQEKYENVEYPGEIFEWGIKFFESGLDYGEGINTVKHVSIRLYAGP